VATIIVPAHNESQVIGRLLGRLLPGAAPGELDVIVVANGCTDDTAAVAASFGPQVRVISLPVASKPAALAAGNRAAGAFPRVYVDADVELRAEDVRALVTALGEPGVLAAAPGRDVRLTASSWTVRWYYDVWNRLPEVRRGLFARGVIAVGRGGHERVASLPTLLSDDLAVSLAFAPAERRVVASARVIIHAPRTFGDLLRRRIRAANGVAQLERTSQAPASTARTRGSDLVAIARADPRLLPRVALFLLVAVAARLAARRYLARGDFTTWLRDESSRLPAAVSDRAGDGR
jgi:glycosyltransferase involved in cell wall biosynthesis